jgi:hypothetical protein
VPVTRRAIPRLPPNTLLPLIGFVAQNPIGFAYTSPHRAPQSTFQLQLFWRCICGTNGPAISASQLGGGLASSFANVAAAEASGSAARWCVLGLSDEWLFRSHPMGSIGAIRYMLGPQSQFNMLGPKSFLEGSIAPFASSA